MAMAGAVWTAVGSMLMSWAIGWLGAVSFASALTLASTGAIAGLGAWRGMRILALNNIERLKQMPERGSVLSFISGKSWLITAFMVVMGSTLRHSALPKVWLSIPYLAMGLALFLASLAYYQHLSRRG